MPGGLVDHPRSVHIQALDVVVAIPAVRAHEYTGFETRDVPADVVLDETDPVALSGAVTQAVVDRTALLTVHAAVVHGPSGAIAIPGRSGLGKSTLTAALVQAGFGLLSDEVLAIDRDTGEVVGFPRPITLDQRSRQLLGLPVDPRADPASESVTSLDELGALGPSRCRLATVVLATRSDGVELRLSRATPGDSAAGLIENAFNHYRSPRSSLATITRAVAPADSYRMTYPQARDAAALLALRLRHAPT